MEKWLARRDEMGISNERMAYDLNLSPCYLANVLHGKRSISISKLENIAEYLGLDKKEARIEHLLRHKTILERKINAIDKAIAQLNV